MEWTVPAEWDGERADRVLANISGIGRPAVRTAIEVGAVLLDGVQVEPRVRVATGSVFAGAIDVPEVILDPEEIEFGIAYEDDHLAVIDKPPGLVTHPGAGNQRGTLAAGVLHRWPTIRGVGAEQRWGIVHRLDRDTSGLLVIALTQNAYEGLSRAIKERSVTREYLCLVAGAPETAAGTIDAAIGRDPRRPTRMRIDAEGRHALTHYRVESSDGRTTLLRVTLETGRTHQIRVHLASIGLPVAGDRVYGRAALSPRLFLHATRLQFAHPITAESVDVTSPLPLDLAAVLSHGSSI